jgi:hypothetical protein
MITIKMTEAEYEAYKLYLKSIDIMQKAGNYKKRGTSLDKYLSDPENIKDIEAGLEDIKAGKVTFVDPDNLWQTIK